jgi:hypothetical protein
MMRPFCRHSLSVTLFFSFLIIKYSSRLLLTDEQKDISCILIHAIKDEGITVYRKIIQVKRTFFFLIVKILYTHFFLQ